MSLPKICTCQIVPTEGCPFHHRYAISVGPEAKLRAELAEANAHADRLAEALRIELADLVLRTEHRTHYEGCEKDHPMCAAIVRVSKSITAHEARRKANAEVQPVATAPVSTNAEQVAFEEWLELHSPSGDHESIRKQWEQSADFRDLIAMPNEARREGGV